MTRRTPPSTLALSALALSLGACSLVSLPDPPTFELSNDDLGCRVDDDCRGVTILSERGTLLSGSDPDGDGPLPRCLVANVGCSTRHGVCEAIVTVRDADGDGAHDPNCQGFDFEPLIEDCDDSTPELTERDADGDGQDSTLCVREPGTDCDDTRDSVFSGQSVEYCDGVISDCDARPGETSRRSVEDMDGDGFAEPDADCETAPSESTLVSVIPKTDCDDTNPFIHPGAPEVCDGWVNDCDAGSGPRANEDEDGDGFGTPTSDCEDSEAFPKTDCDDDDAATYPGAPEICDRIANDCSATERERPEEDADGDGLAPFDADCSGGPIPLGDCVEGGDNDATTALCPAVEKRPGVDESFTAVNSILFLDTNDDGLLDILAGSESQGARLYRADGSGGYVGAGSLLIGTVLSLRDVPIFGALDSTIPDVIAFSGNGNASALCSEELTTGSTAATPILAGVGTGLRDVDVIHVSATDVAFVATNAVTGAVYAQAFTVDSGARCARTLTLGGLVAQDTSTRAEGATTIAIASFLDASGVEDAIVGTMDGRAVLYRGAVPTMTNARHLRAGTEVANGLGTIEVDATGDLDGNGHPDVVFGSSTGIFALLNGDGTATGYTVAEVAAGTDFPTPTSVHAVDLDYDGVDEIVATSESLDAVVWWDHDPTEERWIEHQLVTDFNGASAVASGDVDLDGDLDILATAANAGLVTWFTRELSSRTSFETQRVDRAFDGAVTTAMVRIDADARDDLVAFGADLTWWRIETVSGATVFRETRVATGFVSPAAMTTGDLNGDGETDIVTADGAVLELHTNVAGASSWTTTPIGTEASSVVALALADVNGDDALDVITVTATTLQYWTSSGGSTPSFTATSVATLSSDATAVAAGDTDGDGRVELVVSTAVEDGVIVHTRAASSEDFTSEALSGSPRAADVALSDLSGDGVADIVVGRERLATPFIGYWAYSGASYAAHTIDASAETTWVHRVELGDVDSDGDVDVVAACRVSSSPRIRWFERVSDAEGGWIAHTLTSGLIADGVALGDPDGDGDVDVISALGADAEVVLLANDGVAWWRPSGP